MLFSLLFSLFAPRKCKFTASPRKKRGKTKTGHKNLLLIRIKKGEIVRPKISLRARKTTVWKEFALLHQIERLASGIECLKNENVI